MESDDSTDKKLELMPSMAEGLEDHDNVSVIVKVRRPDYVPSGFLVRARIDETMFTADCSVADMRVAEQDPLVESMALSRRLTKKK
jgi:hypothetical protein